MINKKQEEELKYFLENINQVVDKPFDVYMTGLIVIEKGSKVKPKDIAELMGSKRMATLSYSEEEEGKSADDELISQLVGVFDDKKWALVDMTKDPSALIYNQLKHLADNNAFQIYNYKGHDVFNMKIPASSRVVVVIEREFLNKKISNPNFMTIFKVALSLK